MSLRGIVQILCVLMFVLYNEQTKGQESVSWEQVGGFAVSDTIGFDALLEEVEENWLYSDPDTAEFITLELHRFARESGLRYRAVRTLYTLATIKFISGDYRSAIDLAAQSLAGFETLNDDIGASGAHNLMGNVYADLAEFDKALVSYTKSLVLREKAGDNERVAMSLSNIGLVFSDRFVLTKNPEDYHKAIVYLQRSVDVSRRGGFRDNLANSLVNLGLTKFRNGKHEGVLELFRESLAIKRSTGTNKGVVSILSNIGLLLTELGQYEDAELHCLESMGLAELTSSYYDINSAAQCLYLLYKEWGKYDKALEMHVLHKAMTDSLKNEEITRAVMDEFYRQEYALKEALILAETEAERKVSETKLKQRESQRNLIGALLMLSMGFAYFIFRSQRNQAAANRAISKKNLELEEKNREILDSIDYAKKLQEAVLPRAEALDELFEINFLLYLPKDVVSGDFYWFEKSGSTVFFAVADCTGHGVPGAMLSIIGLNGLNRCVNELNMRHPGEILERLTSIYRVAFEKSATTVRDGMDIAFCALDTASGELSFAGANIPLIVVRDGSVQIIKANRRPIGFHDVEMRFNTEKFALQKGDMLFLATDGYPDQLGGSKGKKLRSSYFRQLLAELVALPMTEQRDRLLEIHREWRGAEPATDDICIMAIKV